MTSHPPLMWLTAVGHAVQAGNREQQPDHHGHQHDQRNQTPPQAPAGLGDARVWLIAARAFFIRGRNHV